MVAQEQDAPPPLDRGRKVAHALFDYQEFTLFWWASPASLFGSMIQTVVTS